MRTNRELLPFMILDTYNQKETKPFLYDFNNVDEILAQMTPIKFIREYNTQYNIAIRALEFKKLDKMIESKYILLKNVLKSLKTDFDTMYPIEKYPEYYL